MLDSSARVEWTEMRRGIEQRITIVHTYSQNRGLCCWKEAVVIEHARGNGIGMAEE